MVSFMPLTLYLREEGPHYPLNEKLSGPQIWYECFREIKGSSASLNFRLYNVRLIEKVSFNLLHFFPSNKRDDLYAFEVAI
jgi:hypothetical protein